MASLINNVQERLKVTTNMVALLTFKLLTGLMIGLTFALIGQEIIQYGTISFVLVISAVTAMIFKITKPWTWTHLFIFNLICVLVALLLRMYILIAPTA